MCSTPFGLPDFITTDESTYTSPSQSVLNAFRHHCIQHMNF
ncbi:MAG: hypothetical protein NZU63_15125 [Gemmataceae bacterium]|nr:hypothetical protein [Gemmataceae bacterium]MDW8244928.1 hypothetical protein [Thermogemmata sp.]